MSRRRGSVSAGLVGGRARLRVVVMLAAVLALSSADSATIGTIAGPLERSLHVGNTQIGLLVTLSTAVGAVATLPMGQLADRTDRTRLLFSAVVVWSVVMVVNGASTSFTMLLVSRLALGVVMAVAGPVIASLTGDWFPPAERGRIYGFVLSGELVGAGVGFVVSGGVASAASWRWTFWVLAALGFGLSWVVRRVPEPARGGGSRLAVGATHLGADDTAPASAVPATPVDDADPLADVVRAVGVTPYPRRRRVGPSPSMLETVRAVLSIRSVAGLVVASSLGYFFFSGVETFGVLFLQNRFGVREVVASSLLVLVGAGAVLGTLTAGRLADALIRRGVIAARPVVAGVAFLVCAVLFVPALLVPSLLVAAPLLALAAAGLGATNPPLDAARLDLVEPSMWGRAEAVRTVLRSLAQSAAPLLFGWLSTRLGERTAGLGAPTPTGAGGHGHGLDHTFLLMLTPMAVAAVVLLVVVRRTYPRDVAATLAAGTTRDPAGGALSRG